MTPKFTTPIVCYGPGGNIMEILGKARVMLRQLGECKDMEKLSEAVMSAPNYAAALDAIREYFPLDIEDDDE